VSRWLPERAFAFVAPQGVAVARRAVIGRRAGTVETLRVPEGSSGWRAPVEALGAWLSAARAPATLDVVLSHAFVRYLAVTFDPALRTRQEREAYLAFRFRAVFGERSAEWHFGVDRGAAPAEQLGAAVDDSLLQALRAAAGKTRIRSVRPFASAALLRFKEPVPDGDCLAAVSEPGLAGLLLLRGRRAIAFEGRHCSGEPAGMLVTMAALLRAQAGLKPDARLVAVHAGGSGLEGAFGAAFR